MEYKDGEFYHEFLMSKKHTTGRTSLLMPINDKGLWLHDRLLPAVALYGLSEDELRFRISM